MLKKVFRSIKKVCLTYFLANAICIPITYCINKFVPSKKRTAVLTSNKSYLGLPSSFWTLPVDFFMYVPVTLRENLLLRNVEWTSCATKGDLERILQDESIQNIVLIGHGSNELFSFCDGYVTSYDIEQWNFKKKCGEFIQYSCGGIKGTDLKDVILKDPKKGFCFRRKVSSFEIYGVALYKLAKAFCFGK